MAGITSGVWGTVLTGATGGFAAGFSGTLLYGGSLSDAFENGLIGAAWGGVAGAIGGFINFGAWAALSKALAHGVTGSAISLAQGGSWETGFLAGFGAGIVSGYMAGANIVLKTIAAALVGGTASVMGGGKFANGAVTGAVAMLVGAGLKKLGEWHYSRNKELLGEYERLGLKEGGRYSDEELAKMDLREITDNWQKRYHLHGDGNSANRKWVSTDGIFGRVEVVTDGSGYLNISPNVMGTLNRGNGFISHVIKDMVPYYMFGNSALDQTSVFTRFTGIKINFRASSDPTMLEAY